MEERSAHLELEHKQVSGCFLTANGTLSPNGTRHTVHDFARFDGRICKSDSIHSLT